MLKLSTKLATNRDNLERAYRAGFHHAELWLDRELVANWQRIAKVVSGYPISYALHFPNQLDLGSETLKHVAALYRRLGCRSLVIHQPMYDKFHEDLHRLDPDVRLAVENHKLTPQDFASWGGRNSGLALDVEHLWKFTLGDSALENLLGHVREFLACFGEKLFHVHLPGYWPGFKEHRPMYCAREMIVPVLSLLEKAHFNGFVVSETNLEYQNPEELRMDALLFEKWRQSEAGELVGPL